MRTETKKPVVEVLPLDAYNGECGERQFERLAVFRLVSSRYRVKGAPSGFLSFHDKKYLKSGNPPSAHNNHVNAGMASIGPDGGAKGASRLHREEGPDSFFIPKKNSRRQGTVSREDDGAQDT